MVLSEVVRAAGGVVWRMGRSGLEVVVVHRPAYDDWTLPKGKLNKSESEEEGALREVLEETGLRCVLERELGAVSYRDRKGRPKIVRYWLMRPLTEELRPTEEVDEARWLPLDDAIHLVSYEHDRALLRMVERGPSGRENHPSANPRTGRDTVQLFVLRHAKAGVRSEWTAEDHLRPLTKEGFAQAEGLIDLLEGEPLERILSSPYVRCRQSVEPLARRRGLPLELEDRLGEGAGRKAVLGLLEELAGVPAVLCTHGDVIEMTLDHLADLGVVEGGETRLKKGSAWAVERADGEIVGARYLPPPS